MPDDFAAKMPMVKARKQTAIPSVWTHEELKQLVGAIDRGSPKGSRIFVRHMAPFLPFAEGDHLEQLIKAYMVKAHIPMRGKHWGMHSLRHTMASVLLEKDTPLTVISDIIGHLDTNSTAVYLKVDMERLAEYPLDFKEMIRLR